jgi:hypothetical protein
VHVVPLKIVYRYILRKNCIIFKYQHIFSHKWGGVREAQNAVEIFSVIQVVWFVDWWVKSVQIGDLWPKYAILIFLTYPSTEAAFYRIKKPHELCATFSPCYQHLFFISIMSCICDIFPPSPSSSSHSNRKCTRCI